MCYEDVLEEEFRRALSIPMTSIEVGGQEIVLFRPDVLAAGVKAAIGRCLLAYYLHQGLVRKQTKALIVHGSGNTVTAVKSAADEFAPGLEVIAVVYAETSQASIERLRRTGISVVAETPREEGRVGRLDVANRLARKRGHVLIEQHEQPEILTIQRRTFGRAIVERLGGKTPHSFVAGVGTGGTLFGIGSALWEVHPNINLVAVEGLGSTLTLWHAYLGTEGRGYRTARKAVQKALCRYEAVGMSTLLQGHPRNPRDRWFEIDIALPEDAPEVVGIEGLGAGEPTHLIMAHLPEVAEVRIVTDEEAKAGVQLLDSHGIRAVESSGANFFAASAIARESHGPGCILTVTTAHRP